jgi:hypothetical protein
MFFKNFVVVERLAVSFRKLSLKTVLLLADQLVGCFFKLYIDEHKFLLQIFKGTVSRKSWRDECMGH